MIHNALSELPARCFRYTGLVCLRLTSPCAYTGRGFAPVNRSNAYRFILFVFPKNLIFHILNISSHIFSLNQQPYYLIFFDIMAIR